MCKTFAQIANDDKSKISYIILLIIGLFSYSNSNKKAVTKVVSPLTKTDSSATTININEANKDSINYLIVDDYPVTNEMLQDETSNSSAYLKQSGNVFSLEKAWFTNDNLNQTLVFQLYTDYHRVEIYHFKNDDIPDGLITRMEFNIAEGKYKNIINGTTNEQKIKSFSGFVGLSKYIDHKYFTTQKGIKLGDEKKKLIKQYGSIKGQF